MPARLDWDGDGARRHVEGRAAKFVKAACVVVKVQAKRLLSVPGTGKDKGQPTGRDRKGRFKATATHSAPGEPPYKQTGRLRASVADEQSPEGLAGRVGTNVEYGRHLELGTRRGIKPRPWLRRAFNEMKARVGQILASIGPD